MYLFLKDEPGLPPMFVSIDRFAAEDEAQHSYELMWHLHDHPTTLQDGSASNLLPDGTGICLAPSDGGISIVRGQKTPVYQGWLPKYGVGDVEHYPIPTVLNTGLFTVSRRVVTVLCPFRGDMPRAVSVTASPDVGDHRFTIHLSDGTSVTVNE